MQTFPLCLQNSFLFLKQSETINFWFDRQKEYSNLANPGKGTFTCQVNHSIEWESNPDKVSETELKVKLNQS